MIAVHQAFQTDVEQAGESVVIRQTDDTFPDEELILVHHTNIPALVKALLEAQAECEAWKPPA